MEPTTMRERTTLIHRQDLKEKAFRQEGRIVIQVRELYRGSF